MKIHRAPQVRQFDFSISGGGSLYLLQPNTDAARAWVDAHIGQGNGYQPYWPTVVIEHRYVCNILVALHADGPSVEGA